MHNQVILESLLVRNFCNLMKEPKSPNHQVSTQAMCKFANIKYHQEQNLC